MNIYFKHDQKCFNLRVASVIKKENKILLAHDQNRYTLPGGRVHFGESTELAIKRAIFEELQLEVEITKLLSINENFFDYGEDEYHELLFVYLCDVKDDIDMTSIYKNKKVEKQFKFISFEELLNLNFQPEFILSDLSKLSKEITHNVNK